jgi:hypothetical protein
MRSAPDVVASSSRVIVSCIRNPPFGPVAVRMSASASCLRSPAGARAAARANSEAGPNGERKDGASKAGIRFRCTLPSFQRKLAGAAS